MCCIGEWLCCDVLYFLVELKLDGLVISLCYEDG